MTTNMDGLMLNQDASVSLTEIELDHLRSICSKTPAQHLRAVRGWCMYVAVTVLLVIAAVVWACNFRSPTVTEAAVFCCLIAVNGALGHMVLLYCDNRHRRMILYLNDKLQQSRSDLPDKANNAG